jgi:hypothetical protein
MRSLLLGDNAFIGVSHLSQTRARETTERLDINRIVDVVEKSASCGATGFTFTVHPTNFQILKTLRDRGTLSQRFELYPLIPYAQGYARIANEKGTAALAKEVLSRILMSRKRGALVKAGLSLMKLDAAEILGAYIDMELGAYLAIKPENADLKAVLMHAAVTDLGISFQTRNLFDSFMQHIRDNHFCPGFVTTNLDRFVEFFQDAKLSLRDTVIMVPINSIGFQMNPSKESCESRLRELGTQTSSIAISILAGGYLQLDEAVEYLKTLTNLSGVAVGVSSTLHAEETFTKLKALLTT